MKKTNPKDTAMWFRKHAYILLIAAGVLLIVLTLKTQTILITDSTEKYTVQMEYSVFGYCVSAVPMTENARSISADHVFVLGSTDGTVQTAARWVVQASGSDGVKIYTSGYPKNNKKLNAHLCDLLNSVGIQAQEFVY